MEHLSSLGLGISPWVETMIFLIECLNWLMYVIMLFKWAVILDILISFYFSNKFSLNGWESHCYKFMLWISHCCFLILNLIILDFISLMLFTANMATHIGEGRKRTRQFLEFTWWKDRVSKRKRDEKIHRRSTFI